MTDTIAARKDTRPVDLWHLAELSRQVTEAEQALHEALVCSVKGVPMHSESIASAADGITAARYSLERMIAAMQT